MARMVRPTRIVVKEVPLREYPHEKGEINLSQGVNEITVETKEQPQQVWIATDQSGDLPVCGADVDKVSVSIVDKGFVLYSEINSTGMTIKWLAEF